MNFLEAVEKMKEGKKVTRTKWDGENHWFLGKAPITEGEKVIYSINLKEPITPLLESIEATDWEIYEEEKKTLSDRLITRSEAEVTSQIGMYAHEDKIKQALKEFINYIKDFMPTDYGENQDIDNKAKEIFGERLVS